MLWGGGDVDGGGDDDVVDGRGGDVVVDGDDDGKVSIWWVGAALGGTKKHSFLKFKGCPI